MTVLNELIDYKEYNELQIILDKFVKKQFLTSNRADFNLTFRTKFSTVRVESIPMRNGLKEDIKSYISEKIDELHDKILREENIKINGVEFTKLQIYNEILDNFYANE